MRAAQRLTRPPSGCARPTYGVMGQSAGPSGGGCLSSGGQQHLLCMDVRSTGVAGRCVLLFSADQWGAVRHACGVVLCCCLTPAGEHQCTLTSLQHALPALLLLPCEGACQVGTDL